MDILFFVRNKKVAFLSLKEAINVHFLFIGIYLSCHSFIRNYCNYTISNYPGVISYTCGYNCITLTIILLIIFIDRVKKWIRTRKQISMNRSMQGELLENENAVGQDSKKAKRAKILLINMVCLDYLLLVP